VLGGGKINLTDEAKFPLHIVFGPQTSKKGIEHGSQIQQIVDAKGGSPRRRLSESIRRDEICQIRS
jgi:hypothetical protein